MRSTLLVTLSILAAGCGGNVVVDPAGGATTTTGSGSGVSCDQACEAIAAVCPAVVPVEGCAANCAKVDPSFEAVCPSAYHAYLSCIVSQPEQACGTSNACSIGNTAFAHCVNSVCVPDPTLCK